MELIQLLDKHPVVGGGVLGSYVLLLVGYLHLRWELSQLRKEIIKLEQIDKRFLTAELLDEKFKNLKEVFDTRLKAIEKAIQKNGSSRGD